MKIVDLLSDASLKKKSVLEKLIRYKCSLTKEEMFMDVDRELTSEESEWILGGYTSYIQDNQPLEYILWHVDFMGVSFHVTSATLIPRPETEYMIEAVNEWIAETPSCESYVDIGTGCGVLWLSVLYHNRWRMKQGIQTDISPDALEVARKNWDTLFGECITWVIHPEFLEASILDADSIKTLWKKCSADQTPLLLVANLPYIPEKLFDDNTDISVKKREPKFAFVWWDDWLDRYRVMFDQMKVLQNAHLIQCTQFLEMMTWQVEILRKEYWKVFVFEEVKTFHFNIRIVKVYWME